MRPVKKYCAPETLAWKKGAHASQTISRTKTALFKGFVGSNKLHRRKRALSNERNFTRENATDYCMDKVSKTDIGKLCATLGVNVPEIVTSCSIDLEVKFFFTWFLSFPSFFVFSPTSFSSFLSPSFSFFPSFFPSSICLSVCLSFCPSPSFVCRKPINLNYVMVHRQRTWLSHIIIFPTSLLIPF